MKQKSGEMTSPLALSRAPNVSHAMVDQTIEKQCVKQKRGCLEGIPRPHYDGWGQKLPETELSRSNLV